MEGKGSCLKGSRHIRFFPLQNKREAPVAEDLGRKDSERKISGRWALGPTPRIWTTQNKTVLNAIIDIISRGCLILKGKEIIRLRFPSCKSYPKYVAGPRSVFPSTFYLVSFQTGSEIWEENNALNTQESTQKQPRLTSSKNRSPLE